MVGLMPFWLEDNLHFVKVNSQNSIKEFKLIRIACPKFGHTSYILDIASQVKNFFWKNSERTVSQLTLP